MRVLFVAAHPDDVELSCLGTWLWHKSLSQTIYYLVAADCESVSPGVEKESEAVMEILKPNEISRLRLPNSNLPTIENRAIIRHALEKIRDTERVDRVYIPWLHDINQDHQAVAEEAVRVFRYSSIIQWCVPHSCPNFGYDYYQVLDGETIEEKKRIVAMFKSQTKRGDFWFVHEYMDSVTATARMRGLECGYDYAEGFKVWRMIDDGS